MSGPNVLPQKHPGIWRSPVSCSHLSSPSGFSCYLVHSVKFSQHLPNSLSFTVVIQNWMKSHKPQGRSRTEQRRHKPNTGIIPPFQDRAITKGTANRDWHMPCSVFILKGYYPCPAQLYTTERLLSHYLEHTEHQLGHREKRFKFKDRAFLTDYSSRNKAKS